MKALAEIMAWTVVLWATYVVFISGIGPVDVAAGGATALAGAVAARAVRRASGARVGGWGGLGPALRHWPGALLRETGQLATAAVRRDEGTFRTAWIASGTGAGWAVGLLSATPAAFAVDAHDDVVLLHTLTDRPSAVERAMTTGGER